MRFKGELPRLNPAAYRGYAYVFWTYTLADRASGWLDERFHCRFRELLLHTQSRYDLGCPIYVCMPDHIHFIWVGFSLVSDQLRASTFLRKQLNMELAPLVLQRQAYDHVLDGEERSDDRVIDAVRYLRLNPVRAGLVEEVADWMYAGSVLPGYPRLNYGTDRFWETYWRCHNSAQISCG
jgi:putative transposase